MKFILCSEMHRKFICLEIGLGKQSSELKDGLSLGATGFSLRENFNFLCSNPTQDLNLALTSLLFRAAVFS